MYIKNTIQWLSQIFIGFIHFLTSFLSGLIKGGNGTHNFTFNFFSILISVENNFALWKVAQRDSFLLSIAAAAIFLSSHQSHPDYAKNNYLEARIRSAIIKPVKRQIAKARRAIATVILLALRFFVSTGSFFSLSLSLSSTKKETFVITDNFDLICRNLYVS